MIQLLIFIVITILGYLFGSLSGINLIAGSSFSIFSTIALALGLYVSVAGIELSALGRYKKIAIFIITAGVPLQIGLTALIMYLIYPDPISILIAVAIDQIDPLSVSTLLNNKLGMSSEAKSLLRVWASFDDPVTVLVGFAFLLPVFAGVNVGSAPTYLLGLLLNLVPGLILYVLYKSNLLNKKSIQIVLLVASLVFVVITQSFLFAAIAGLFLRPFNAEKLSDYITGLYYLVIFIVGAGVVYYGIDLRLGILLALVEFFIVQPLSALFMVKGTTNDIFRLAFAQQNGLTTILMGLGFQSLGFNVLGILLPAIIVINILNLSINGYYSWKENSGQLVTKADKKQLDKFKETLAIS